MSANNHLLYRGYVVDKGTGLYYLQSRYYDPNVGRFINADAFASTGQGILGNNMFAYCGNNPVMFADSSGTARIPCTVVINDGDRSEKKKRKFANYVERADQKSSIFDYDFGPFGKIGLYFVATTTTQEEGFIYAFNDIECEGEGLGSDWAYVVGVGTNICDLMGASFGASTELNTFGEIQFLNTHRRISTGIDGIGYTTGIDIFNCAFELEIEGGVGSWLLAALFNPANKWDEWYFVPIPV